MLYFILKLRCYFNIYFIFDNNYENNKENAKEEMFIFQIKAQNRVPRKGFNQ